MKYYVLLSSTTLSSAMPEAWSVAPSTTIAGAAHFFATRFYLLEEYVVLFLHWFFSSGAGGAAELVTSFGQNIW